MIPGRMGGGLGMTPARAAPAAGGGVLQLHPDPGFDTSGAWTFTSDNDPPIVDGKLRFDAAEQGIQTATCTVVGGSAAAGNYVLGLDVDSISATLMVELVQAGFSVGSNTFDASGAGQTKSVTAADTFDSIRYTMTAGAAVLDNGSLQLA